MNKHFKFFFFALLANWALMHLPLHSNHIEAGLFIPSHFFEVSNLKSQSYLSHLYVNPEDHQDLYSSDFQKESKYFKQGDTVYYKRTEGEPYFIEFLPVYVGTLTPSNNYLKHTSPCFQNTEIELKTINNEAFELIHNANDASSLTCTDLYFYSTLVDFKIKLLFFSGLHKIKFNVSPKEFEQISKTGIYIFRTCNSKFNFIVNLLKVASQFLGGFGLDPSIPFFGGKPMSWQIQQNIEFIEQSKGYKWQERPHDVVVDIDESLFQSGDFLAITRFDGIDQLIEYATGSHVGHCVMILKVDNETYVVEVQEAWYWPRPNIQINPYKQWIEWARNVDYQVAWVPLKKEYAQKFNATAAYEFFKKVEGTPYGFENFIFGWIDTPDQTYPPGFSADLGMVIFAALEKVIPTPVAMIFSNGLNKRLGTENLKVGEIAHEAINRGSTLAKLLTVPEEDGWTYSTGVSYVCSSLVIAMYKAGGLFGDLDINPGEFTPRDLYQLDFFDQHPQVPENCKKVDPENPFCQIMGKYRFEFPGLGTVSPYSHMNENCTSIAPLYSRFPENC